MDRRENLDRASLSRAAELLEPDCSLQPAHQRSQQPVPEGPARSSTSSPFVTPPNAGGCSRSARRPPSPSSSTGEQSSLDARRHWKNAKRRDKDETHALTALAQAKQFEALLSDQATFASVRHYSRPQHFQSVKVLS